VERAKQSHNTAELRDAMTEAAESYDLHAFNYFSLPVDATPRQPIISASFPAGWVQRYYAAQHFLVDPLIAKLQHAVQPFAWGTTASLRDLNARQKQMFDEARGFGLHQGFSVTAHRDGAGACFSYVSDQKEPVFLRLLEQHHDDLRMLAANFHVYAAEKLPPWQEDARAVLHRIVAHLKLSVAGRPVPAQQQAIATATQVLGEQDAEIYDVLDALDAATRHLVESTHRSGSTPVRDIIQMAIAVLETNSRPTDFLQ
jgi:hypothetical protein